MLAEQEVAAFRDEGYLVLEPGRVLSEADLSRVRSSFNRELPDYEAAENAGPGTGRNGWPAHVKLSGCALRQRQLGGRGSIISECDRNALFGKRATVQVEDLRDPSICENENVVSVARAALGTDDIVFHNGSFAASYPGNTANAGQFHTDTVNFCSRENNMRMRREGRFLVNVLMYMDDVSDTLAPVRVVPGSHRLENFLRLNEAVAASLRKSPDQDQLSQENWIYDELIPDVEQQERKILGPAGTTLVMNSSLLHGATENFTSALTRRVIILNYANARVAEFGRQYSLTSSRQFLNRIKKKELGRGSFSESASAPRAAVRRLERAVAGARPVVARQIHRMLHPGVARDRASYLVAASLRPRGESRSPLYLNIGGGKLFSHYDFVNLDYVVEDDPPFTVRHDLGVREPLPFESESFRGIYTSHCLEHLQHEQVVYVLSESFRVLKGGGTIRVTVPDIGAYFRAYRERDAAYFDWLKRNPGQMWVHDRWLRAIVRSFAGHVVDQYSDKEIYDLYGSKTVPEFIETFTSVGDAVTDKRFLEPDSHKSAWSVAEMSQVLEEAGFSDVQQVLRWEGRDRTFLNKAKFNYTQPQMSFFVEASK